MKITELQRDLMEHTVKEKGRNWFGTDKAGSDGQEFEKLVEMGLATSRKASSWMGEDTIYHLTLEGKKTIGKRD